MELKVHSDNPPLTDQSGNLYCLLPGKLKGTGPALQLDVFGGWVNLLPSMTAGPSGILLGTPLELAPASHHCTICDQDVQPEPLSDPTQGWIQYPCHEKECGTCYSFSNPCGTCGDCDSHCTCVWCGSCGGTCDTDVCDNCDCCLVCCECQTCDYCGSKSSDLNICGDCEHCEHCGCTCEQRSEVGYGWRIRSAPWLKRDESVDSYGDETAEEWFKANYGRRCDPVLAMADFYLTDFVSAVIRTRLPQARYGRNNGLRPVHELLRDSHLAQSHIVNMFDEAFRAYGFIAVGGELRHHPAAGNAMPTYGRSNSWDWWQAMGNKYGRTQLLKDAEQMFGDSGWSGAYGGKKWREITSILIAREEGRLDPRTFVDRCFTLQHNGGSFLDKLAWLKDAATLVDGYHRWPEGETDPWSYGCYYSTETMKDIGNAHAADTPDLSFLLNYATLPVRHMIHDLFRTLRYKMTAEECTSYDYWMEYRNDFPADV